MCISKKTEIKNERERERERENPIFFFKNQENPIGFQLLSNFTPCFLSLFFFF